MSSNTHKLNVVNSHNSVERSNISGNINAHESAIAADQFVVTQSWVKSLLPKKLYALL